MNSHVPHDELLQRYEQAKATLPDGLPDQPSVALHERIMQAARAHSARAAREQINAINTVAPRADSMPATGLKSLENTVKNQAPRSQAANDSFWNIRALGSLTVMGLAGLLWWQFEHGTPEEQEAARSAKPSSTVVAATPALAAAAAPALASTSASEPVASPAASVPPSRAPLAPTAPLPSAAPPAANAPAKNVQAKIAAQPSSKAEDAEMATLSTSPAPPSLPAAAPEAARARTQDAAPSVAAAPAPAPALPQLSQTDKAIAADLPARKPTTAAPAPAMQRSLESTQAPSMAAVSPPTPAPAPAPAAPAPAARSAMPSMPSAAAPPVMARPTAPAPAAPAPPAFSRQMLFSAIEAKDALTLRQSLAQGISPNVIAPDGNPALQQAVIQRWQEGVRILLAAGADRSSKNSKGHTATDVALELGYEDMSRLLEAPR